MSNTVRIIIAIVVVAVIVAAAWLVIRNQSGQPAVDTPSPSNNQDGEPALEGEAAVITYDGSGFDPSSLTVKSGAKVTVTNQSQKEMEFASGPHPTHTNNSDLNIGDIAPGSSKTFTATAKGTWGFHDHYNANVGGTITVE